MKPKCVRGERFFVDGRPWACLDVQGKRLLAVQMLTGEARVFPTSAVRNRPGKGYTDLIKAIDDIQSRIVPGSIIQTDAGRVWITKVFRSGAAEGVNEQGDRCPVDRWILMGRIAGVLVAQKPTQPSPSPTESKCAASVTPPSTNKRMAVPASDIRSGMVGRIWKRLLEMFRRGISSRTRDRFGGKVTD